ncbi:Mitochondrial distribution and morphology protein 10 [Thecaphora frezii]
MYDFVSHLLRRYFEATGWNEHNSYLNLTASSSALLDFPIPSGLSFSISAAPSRSFFTSYRLAALPDLRGGIGYIYTSTDEPLDLGRSSRDVDFKHIIERFRIHETPKRPQGKAPTWLAGERVDARDYMVYGCMHIPSSRLDALYTLRIAPTWQLLVTAVSTPPKYPISALASIASASRFGAASADKSFDSIAAAHLAAAGGGGGGAVGASGAANAAAATAAAASTSASAAQYGAGPPGSTNLQLTLQNDTGRWFTEYSYSADDALWGFRVLHNFGTPSSSSLPAPSPSGHTGANGSSGGSEADSTKLDRTASAQPPDPKEGGGLSGSSSVARPKRRINESGHSDASDSESAVGGGLRGRFSAGAEIFVSTVEKSAGMSTGIRFATVPEAKTAGGVGVAPSQPPTVLTATLNPMMGHLSMAYAARVARDLAVASRFDFNVYSYESEMSVGVECWLRRSVARAPTHGTEREQQQLAPPTSDARDALAARPTTTSHSTPSGPSSHSLPLPTLRPNEPALSLQDPCPPPASGPRPLGAITGVLKARLSTSSDIRLLWQGRLRNCLVALGVRADLGAAAPPTSGIPNGIVKSVGVEVMYFSQP